MKQLIQHLSRTDIRMGAEQATEEKWQKYRTDKFFELQQMQTLWLVLVPLNLLLYETVDVRDGWVVFEGDNFKLFSKWDI